MSCTARRTGRAPASLRTRRPPRWLRGRVERLVAEIPQHKTEVDRRIGDGRVGPVDDTGDRAGRRVDQHVLAAEIVVRETDLMAPAAAAVPPGIARSCRGCPAGRSPLPSGRRSRPSTRCASTNQADSGSSSTSTIPVRLSAGMECSDARKRPRTLPRSVACCPPPVGIGSAAVLPAAPGRRCRPSAATSGTGTGTVECSATRRSSCASRSPRSGRRRLPGPVPPRRRRRDRGRAARSARPRPGRRHGPHPLRCNGCRPVLGREGARPAERGGDRRRRSPIYGNDVPGVPAGG